MIDSTEQLEALLMHRSLSDPEHVSIITAR